MKRTDIKQHDVFISWTGNDRELKNQIVEYLNTHGIRCLESDHNCSGDFRQWSREAVDACSVFLLLYTESTCGSTYVPIEVEEYQKWDNYENRIVPVCTNMELYQNDPWGICDYGSAVILDGATATEAQLNMILKKTESLIINLLDKVYRDATKPNYMKLIPFYKTQKFSDREYDFSALYIPRTIIELDDNKQVIATYSVPTELCNSEDIIFISGAAGSGKSRYIDQIREATDEATVTIALPCHKIVGTTEDLFLLMFHEFSRFCGNRYFYTEEDFKSLLNNRHLLLILDGLDEIATREGTRKLLAKVEEYYKANMQSTTLVLTSRRENDADLIAMCSKKVRCFELTKLSNSNIRTLSANLFLLFGSEEKQEAFFARIKDLNSEIKSNPLLLSQLAIIYEDSGEIPQTVVGIHDAISEITFKFDRGIEISDIPDAYRDMVTTKIPKILKAFSMERYHLRSRGKEIDICKIFSRVLKDEYGSESSERAEYLVEYLKNRAIIIDDEFYHKMFLEYFTAVCYCDRIFDDYGEIENPEILEELFSHYKDAYWSAVIKLFLVKADSYIDSNTTKELYGLLVNYDICDYTLLFDACRDLTCCREAQTILVLNILQKSVDGTYPPYGPFFWYVSEYELYEAALFALNSLKGNDYFAQALALVRDVCFIFGQKNTANEITDKIHPTALYMTAQSSLSGVRGALCELFYTGKTDFEGGEDIYPRCFNVAEAKSFLDIGCGICQELSTPFEDELELYKHTSYNELNDEYIGFISCSYEVNLIEQILSNKSCQKVCGMALAPTDDTQMKYIAFNNKNVKALYLPENICDYNEDWNDRMPLQMFLWHRVSNASTLKMYCRNYVHVPEELTEICDEAFKGFTKLEAIHISEGITKIGNNAFEGCISLMEVTLPNGMSAIKNSTFMGCTNLAGVNLPESITVIESYAFKHCKNLTTIDIPKNTADIGVEAFYGCTNLIEISIPEGITEIKSRTFESCINLAKVHIPETVEIINGNAFSKCVSLKSIHIPNSVNYLGGNAFSGCSNLVSIQIPDGVTEIRGGLFGGCTSLIEIELPANVTHIGGGAFKNCSNLSRINLPDSILTIKSMAFEGCTSLTELRLPDSIQTIGRNSFLGCSSLTKITNCPTWAKVQSLGLTPDVIIEKSNYMQSSASSVYIEVEDADYSYNREIQKITIGKAASEIKMHAFYACENLAEVTVENGIKMIGEGAFMKCNKLAKVSIAHSVAHIGTQAFKDCVMLSSITLPSGMKSIEPELFMRCKRLKRITLPNGITEIKRGAFAKCNRLSQIRMPLGITAIHSRAFSHCMSLREIQIPETVQFIGTRAFSNCVNMQQVCLPNNLETIKARTFISCKKLTMINIPDKVASIEEAAFAECESLKFIVLPNKLTELGDSAFRNCTNMLEIELPEHISKIPSRIFEGCAALTNMNLPSAITSIENYAFKDCAKLTHITIPPSVRKIGEGAFLGCTGLCSVTISRRFEGDISRIFGDIDLKMIHFV